MFILLHSEFFIVTCMSVMCVLQTMFSCTLLIFALLFPFTNCRSFRYIHLDLPLARDMYINQILNIFNIYILPFESYFFIIFTKFPLQISFGVIYNKIKSFTSLVSSVLLKFSLIYISV